MKNTFKGIALFLICFVLSCTKEPSIVSNTSAPQGSTGGGSFGHSTARYAGSNYSQSIPLDSVNGMIQSYLASVQYPSKDTSMRSITMDVDTLLAYLTSYPNIGTLKFILGHQAGYKNNGNSGKYSGWNPAAMTMIIAGMDDNSAYVLNNRGGVYQHFSGAPNLKSIAVDSANSMIESYLTSVQYPSRDTALRSLSFDADTLRTYVLGHPEIVKLKFIFAHQPGYKNGNNGKYAGMNPNAMTMIIAGLNNNNEYVLSSQNGLYEHFRPCPNYCPGNATPTID